MVVVSVAVLFWMSGVAWAGPPSTDRWCENFGSEFPALCYPAPVPQTGQTVSYDEDDDGDLRMGVEWPDPRFTVNLTESGEPDGTVTDNLTGLIWLRDADCLGWRPWIDALDAANGLFDECTNCGGSEGDCGLSDGSAPGDWRLPNIRELQSLIDYGAYDPDDPSAPKLPAGHPFTGVQWSWYWSSSSYVPNPTLAWLVNMYNGNDNRDSKADNHYVWPVRGGQ